MVQLSSGRTGCHVLGNEGVGAGKRGAYAAARIECLQIHGPTRAPVDDRVFQRAQSAASGSMSFLICLATAFSATRRS